MAEPAAAGTSMRTALVFSAILHAAGIAALIGVQRDRAEAMPPLYKVNIVAAPPGPRAIGTVNPPSTPTPPAPTPPPPRPETPERSMPAPPTPTPPRRTPPPPATPVPPNTGTTTPSKAAPATPAGGGPTGGRGADVATVRTEGIDFPYPGYLNNIVRQIALRFSPRNPGALRAEVFFIVRRDGTIGEFRFLTKSGSYAFDLEAQGAIEAAGSAKAFGRLPDGYVNDFLPVIFSFDPSLFR